jgi:Rrf2 family transcriptional regulator, iron-sulfur cluster assembly transcription factor
MMGLTRKGEYAIRGIIYLAQQAPEQTVLMDDIARETQAPATFLAKIFQSFARAGIVRSSRGTGGGFALVRPAAQISLRQVVEAVEGPILPNRCLTKDGACERDDCCRVHKVWHTVQKSMLDVLEAVTIEDLTKGP